MGTRKHRCPNPKCRRVLVVPAEMQGREVRCGGCNELFLVPLRIGTGRGTRRRLRKAG